MIHDADDITCGEQDKGDAELDALLAAADAELLAAIRSRLDLESGLARIISAHLPELPALVCETCGRPLVRLTVRWLDTDTLSDYCPQSPTLFHTPGEEG